MPQIFMRELIVQLAFVSYLTSTALIYYLKKIWFYFVPFLVFLLIFSIKFYLFPGYTQPDNTVYNGKVISIPKGASFRNIADLLEKEQLLDSKNMFLLLGKVTSYQNKIKAGAFIVPYHMHPWHLLNYLMDPVMATRKVTFPEGICLEDYAGILQREMQLDSIQFMQLVSDSAICQKYNVPAENLEGYLLPETYYLPVNSTIADVVDLLVNNTLSILNEPQNISQMEIWGMSRHEVLTLASIIEGEAVIDSERVIISSVYHNRLDKGWRLQADPTIQYILPGKPRRLLNKHLQIDSPYNTYLNKGLPPGPINNPGKKSILAALYPEETGYMYFVARGDGGHYFARTAAEHSRNKQLFDQVRREVRRNRWRKNQR